MSIVRLIVAIIMAGALMATPVMAGDKGGEAANPCAVQNPCAANPCGMKNPCMMKRGKKMYHKWGKSMGEHHRMMSDLMEIMRDTMAIVKNLDHRPTPVEKKRLGAMADKLDRMMKKHKETGKRHKKMKERCWDSKEI